MRKLFIFLSLILIAGITFGIVKATSNPHSWDNGLVGYWSFDGKYTTSTDGTADVSGNGNWGAFNNGVKPVGGISGQALSFDGVDDYVDCGSDSSLDFGSGDFTLAAWVYVKSLEDDGTFDRIITKKDGTTEGGYALTYTKFTEFSFGYGTGSSVGIRSNTGKSINTWYFVVGVRKGSNKYIYVNGIEDSNTENGHAMAASDHLFIGARHTDTNSQFHGLIDEVRIYNRALSAEEIMQHYEQTRRNFQIASANPHDWSDGLVGYWTMNGQDISGSTLIDKSPEGNNGTISGAVGKAGVVGQALSFDGVDDYVDLTSHISNLTLSAGTYEAWFKSSSSNHRNYIIAGGYSPGLQEIHNIEIGGNITGAYDDESVGFYVTTGGVSQLAMFIRKGTDYYNDGKWHHIVVIADGVHNTIYVDGVEQSITYRDGDSTTSGYFLNSANTDALYFGRRAYSPDTGSYLNGFIDEVRIYNRALGAEEVMTHFKQSRRNLKVASANPHDWSDSLVGFWDFNGQNTTSTGTRDMSGEDNWGELKNGVGVAGGIVGQALSFDGVDDYVDIANESNFDMSDAITVETWAYIDPLASGLDDDVAGIITKTGGRAQVNKGWYTTFDDRGARDNTIRWIGHQELGTYFEAYASIQTAGWYHIVGTFDKDLGGTEEAKLYINGVKEASDDYSDTIGNNDYPVKIGAVDNTSGGAQDYFPGLIDEVRIYNRALGAEEVMMHYKQTRRLLRI